MIDETILERFKAIEEKLEAKTGIDLPTPLYAILIFIAAVELLKLVWV